MTWYVQILILLMEKKNALKKELLKSEFDFLMQDHIQSIHSMKILKVSQFLAT